MAANVHLTDAGHDALSADWLDPASRLLLEIVSRAAFMSHDNACEMAVELASRFGSWETAAQKIRSGEVMILEEA